MESIADSAFRLNQNITSFTIDSKNTRITEIPLCAFSHCYNLTKVDIPNVTTIGEEAFNFCHSLSTIDVSNVKYFGENSFVQCPLTSVDLSSAETIDFDAFTYTNLESLYIPATATKLGDSPFTGCRKLTSITVDKDNPVYDSRENCNAIIETATNTLNQGCNTTVIPNTVERIGYSAFFASNIESVSIPNSVTYIKGLAFCYCEKLTSIVLPPNLPFIELDLLKGCTSLKSVSIPASVTSIVGEYAFSDDKNLSIVAVNWTTPLEISEKVFASVKDGTLIVPRGTSELYRNAKGYENFTTILESGSSSATDEDVNKDGQVNSLDVLKVYKYMQSH